MVSNEVKWYLIYCYTDIDWSFPAPKYVNLEKIF